MRLTRLHHDGPLRAGATLALEAGAARHLVSVLRMKVGDGLRLFDGAGHEHEASIASLRNKRVEVTVGEATVALAESPLAITLAQGVSRGERMDYAFQKATELGVRHLVPLLCERSVVKLDPAQAQKRLEHWRGVVIAACEQCGRATLPTIAAPTALDVHLAEAASNPAAIRVVLSPDAAAGLTALPQPVREVELLVGPEGGFSALELALAARTGYRALRLGPRVLRTETAAAAAIAALQALRGDLG